MRTPPTALVVLMALAAEALLAQTPPDAQAPEEALIQELPARGFASPDPVGEHDAGEASGTGGAAARARQNPQIRPDDDPVVVEVGVFVRQITSVDQKAENFGIVGYLEMQWSDPSAGFDAEACGCEFKFMHTDQFVRLAEERNTLWPEFVIANKQGRVFYDLERVRIEPDGHVTLAQSFSTTLQAPDFDFRQYPFDDQEFYVRIVSYFPEDYFIFKPLPDSGVGDQLGEEEWVVTSVETIVDTTPLDRSRFSLKFDAERHTTYYVFRIFIPLLVMITVSWTIFFLGDYSKRIDLASGNLLLFIAFNFVIAGQLPRLGYLTLMDVVLMSAFVATGLILICNVFLRRLELTARTELAHRIDRAVIWLYPLVYAVGIAGVIIYYFA